MSHFKGPLNFFSLKQLHLIAKQAIRLAFLTAALFIVMYHDSSAAWSKQENGEIHNAIVKIFTVVNRPNYYRPWQQSIERGVASGCIIEGNKILTNAHVIANSTFIEVRKNGQPRRYEADVFNVSHEADLALLTVADQTFFNNVEPLQFGGLPEVQQEVLVYGFPTGGDTLSITKGIVSRIEHISYVHSSLYFLAGQIDAAINPGNSGGPVLADGRIVGVAMQGRRDAENIGYLIPVPVIQHFLDDIRDGSYDGFPDLGLVTQEMENPNMKRMYGMTKDMTGVFIRHIPPTSPAFGILQKEDIILEIDNHPISDDGTVEFRPGERTMFGHYVDMHQLGDELRLTILRENTVKNVTLTLNTRADAHLLVPFEQHDTFPRYFIFGGIVFSPLTKDLIMAWGGNWQTRAPEELVLELSNWPTKEKKEVVVILQVLAADINKGYHDISSWIVEEVNGKPYRDFDEFFHMVTTSEDQFVVFKNRKEYRIVIDRQKALETHDAVLQTYRIPSDRSSDLIAGGEN